MYHIEMVWTQRPAKRFIEVVKEDTQIVGGREDDGEDGSGSDESKEPRVGDQELEINNKGAYKIGNSLLKPCVAG